MLSLVTTLQLLLIVQMTFTSGTGGYNDLMSVSLMYMTKS